MGNLLSGHISKRPILLIPCLESQVLPLVAKLFKAFLKNHCTLCFCDQ